MPDLPSGIVTLLFTDIAGFTRLGQQLGERLADQVAEHRRLLRAAYAAHGGHAVNAFGDSTFAVFASAADAVAAAAAAQRAFAGHDWPEGVAVQVRIGLHTAELSPADEGRDYVGPEVDRAAVLNMAGHGGQVLLSQATAVLVADALPPGTTLKDLGDHYLRDSPQPERLFQLAIAGLPADFPPPRARAGGPHNLPVPPTPLVGREREVAAVSALLRAPDTRLVTLTGPGGVGKTRLGLLVAAGLAEDFPDGVAFVPLAAVSDPALVVPAIAAALGVREVAGQPLAAALAAFLRARRVLLLLDNFEQVLPAAAALAELLAACPGVTLLVTSRAALRIAAEREYTVPPLDLPAPNTTLAPDDLWRNEAVRLFVERARGVAPAFRATAADAHAIAAICRRLDGLPLAIELAAARSRLLAPPALLARLERRLTLLTGGGADLPARQQTLRGTLDWSYLLLGADDQALFARLAVFVGDWTLEAAEAVCGDIGGRALDVLTGLESLASKNLVQQTTDADGAPRLRLLETIREYALERLAASGERDEASNLFRRHAAYYLALAESEPAVRGPAWGAWLARLDQEYDNVRAALGWALDAGETELVLRFGVALRRFWHARGEISQGRRWLAAALAGGDVPAAELRARAIHALANLGHYQGDYQQAQALYEESLRLWRAIGDQPEIAAALARLAEVRQHQGDYARARVLHEEALALWRAVGDARGIGEALAELGMLAYRQGEFPRATALLEEGLALARRAGDTWLAARCLAELSAVALYRDEPQRARQLAVESLALGEELGDQRTIVEAFRAEGWAALALGANARAQARLGESLVLYREAGVQWGVAFCLEGLAAAAARQGRPERAARLGGAAEALREAIGAPPPPPHRAHYERYLTATRGRVGAAAWTTAWAAGRALPMKEAIVLALAQEPADNEWATSPPASDSRAGLSTREVEVLGLVAQGLTNAQVAARLFLSPRTIDQHLRSIYNKLGVSSRAAAAAFAVTHGLR